jgi:hypothetical protein
MLAIDSASAPSSSPAHRQAPGEIAVGDLPRQIAGLRSGWTTRRSINSEATGPGR